MIIRKPLKWQSSYFSDGGGSIPGGAGTPNELVTTPTIFTTTIAIANTEQSYAVPANTKQVEVVNFGSADLKLAYAAGESGTNYRTIPCGAGIKLPSLDSSASITLYFQSAAVGGRVEIESWT